MQGTLVRNSKVYAMQNGEMVETGDSLPKGTSVNLKTFVSGDDACEGGYRGFGNGQFVKNANVQCEDQAA